METKQTFGKDADFRSHRSRVARVTPISYEGDVSDHHMLPYSDFPRLTRA